MLDAQILCILTVAALLCQVNPSIMPLSYCHVINNGTDSMVPNSHTDKEMDLKIGTWNMRSFSGGHCYMHEMSKTCDIIAFSEHGLYDNELYRIGGSFTDFSVFARSSQDMNPFRQGTVIGHCGCGIMWHKSIDAHITPLYHLGSDRICAVELDVHGNLFFIVSVYLPYQKCKIADFEEQLAILGSMLATFKIQGEVVIMGDMNAHLGAEYGTRGWGSTSVNGKKLAHFAEHHNLVFGDMSDLCVGPVYTFMNEMGQYSYIDHILLSAETLQSINDCGVIDESPSNTSDHLPLYISLHLRNCTISGTCASGPTRVAWGRDQNKTHMYKVEVDRLLSQNHTTEIPNEYAIEETYGEIVSILNKTANCIVGTRKHSTHQKPYWKPVLTACSKTKKQKWRAWVVAGKPRGEDDLTFQEYKTAKRILRNEQRQAQYEYEIKCVEELTHNATVDQKFFWRLVNKTKGKKVRTARVKKADGSYATSDGDIVEIWRNYFEALYTPMQNAHFNSDLKNTVDSLVRGVENASIDNYNGTLDFTITEDEVCTQINKLKSNKAPGWDMVCSEHLKYGGPVLHGQLTNLFNAIVKTEHIPSSFRKGVVIPIPKGNKDPSITDNNRGITLMPVIAKLFNRVILERYRDWFISNIPDIQGACQEKCSSIHTSMLLREAVAYNVEKGSSVYVVLLDARKAFDTVWINGLFYMLHNKGIDIKLWRLLKHSYDDFSCVIRIGSVYSEPFTIKQGVHQGDIFSMLLYQIYNADLLNKLKVCGQGAGIGDIDVASPAFADDISMVSLHKKMMAKMLDIAYRYSLDWRFEFNASKSFLMVFGIDKSPNFELKLGNNAIQVTTCEHHMGIPLTTTDNDLSKCVDDKIQACQSRYFAVKGLGTHKQGVPPPVMSRLYNSACIGKITYGTEIIGVSKKDLEKLEKIHCRIAKSIQGMPPTIPNVSCCAPLGWLSIEAVMDVARLLFLWRIMLLPWNNIYKRVFVHRLCQINAETKKYPNEKILSGCRLLVAVAEKYQLMNYIWECLFSFNKMPYSTWKSIVKERVKRRDSARWSMSCQLFKSLGFYRLAVHNTEMFVWWKLSNANPRLLGHCKIIMKVIYGAHDFINGQIRRATPSSRCSACDMYDSDTLGHTLFVCPSLETKRIALWKEVKQTLPPRLLLEVEGRVGDEKVALILSGYNAGYIKEWHDIYVSTLMFVVKLLETRELSQQLQDL